MNNYDKKRYEYMANLMYRIKKYEYPEDMHRLYKMFEGLCKRISWNLSSRYDIPRNEIDGDVYTEFMLLVKLYRIESNMTFTSFVNKWLYLKSDRSVSKIINDNLFKNTKHKKIEHINCYDVIEYKSPRKDFNFHFEFLEFIKIIRKKMEEVDIDILILSSLYGFSKEKISSIINMEPDKISMRLLKMKKLLIKQTYGEK